MGQIKKKVRNLKISTRITLSIIFGTLIPLVIVGAFTAMFFSSFSTYLNVSTVNTNSYSLINEFQWDQVLTNIGDELISNESKDEKLSEIEKTVKPLEKRGTLIYIESSKGEFYSSADKDEIFKKANAIVKLDKTKNTNCFSEKGMVILTHAKTKNESYLILVTNEKYEVEDVLKETSLENLTANVFGRGGFIIILIATIFIISAVVLSLITSSTIRNPIRKLEEGANEISKGNFDYLIDYDSTNEIGITVDAFNDMTQIMKASMKYQNEIEESKKEIIAGVAHDLRTPLTSVKGYVEGLMDGIADTPEKQERYLQTIYNSTMTMEKLLDELLTVSKLDTGSINLDLHQISITDFLDDCANNMRIAIESRGFEFVYNNKCSPEATVLLDSDQFQRVIRNIFQNSIRYTSKDVVGRIELAAQEYNKTVIISIADNGIGMSVENITKMFDRFFRADQARTKVSEGSGLGLYVCKQLVELHGGKIWATGKEGEGLTVFISLNKEISAEQN